MEVGPVVAGLLELSHPFFQSFLFSHQMLYLLQRVLAREVFQDHEALSQVLILVLKLEYLSVLVVDELRLFLNGLAQAKIALENFFHHVDSVNDPSRNRIFCFVRSVVAKTSLCDDSACSSDSVCIDPIDFVSTRDVRLASI